jgi:hypothetical protein
MPISWNHEPPQEKAWGHCRLLRTPTGKELRGIITSHQLFGCRTHFSTGRTLPCLGNDCKPCADGSSWNWHGYISLYEPTHGSTCILEITDQAAQQLLRQAKAFGTLRGLMLSASRAAKRPNGRVVISIEPHSFPAEALPPPIDLISYLEHMWGIDAAATPPIIDEATIPIESGNGQRRFSLPR